MNVKLSNPRVYKASDLTPGFRFRRTTGILEITRVVNETHVLVSSAQVADRQMLITGIVAGLNSGLFQRVRRKAAAR